MSPLGINSHPSGSNQPCWQGFFSCYKRSYSFSIHLVTTKWLICLHEKFQCLFDAYFVWNISFLIWVWLRTEWHQRIWKWAFYFPVDTFLRSVELLKKNSWRHHNKDYKKIKYLGKWSPMSRRDVSQLRLYTRRNL